MTIASSPPPIDADSTKGSTMFMIVLRVFFVLALIAVGWSFTSEAENRARAGASAPPMGGDLVMIGCVGAAFIVIALDIFLPRKSLTTISGLFFGLVVGMVIAYGLSLIVDLLASNSTSGVVSPVIPTLKLGLGVVCCYMAVSFILQTKDDVRFVIPYVEFAKEMKGAKPFVLDTSVIIDGRIADIANTKIITSELVVPRFVLQELQTIADSSDKLKRVRGRRGLDMLNKLQTNEHIEIRMLDVVPERSAENAGVDEMLVDLAVQLSGKIVTNDYNLNKIAQLRGVPVININDLANSLKPVVLPGETMSVKVVKPGEEAGQGVGYLEDGTMVVAEGARDRLGEMVELTVTSVLQTSAGRMIFGRMDGVASPPGRRRFGPPERPQPEQRT